MTKTLKISVVTPSYNQGQFIEETIQSVLSQNYCNLEYIIIDGQSQDNSIAIIKRYEKSLTYWISEKDTGQSAAINKGLEKTTGEIIAYLNSDDCYTANTLNHVANFFSNNPDIDILIGKTIFVDESSNQIDGFTFKNIEIANDYNIFNGNNIAQPSTFFRRRVLDILGGFDENLHYVFDYDYWIRAYLAGIKFSFVEEIFSKFRLHSESKTVKEAKVGKFEEDFMNAYAKHLVKYSISQRSKIITNAYLDQLLMLHILYENNKTKNYNIIFFLNKLLKVPLFFLYFKSYKLVNSLLIPAKFRMRIKKFFN